MEIRCFWDFLVITAQDEANNAPGIPLERQVGPSEANLGHQVCTFGAIWWASQTILGASWASLDAIWDPLEACWTLFGLLWAIWGTIWGHPRAY